MDQLSNRILAMSPSATLAMSQKSNELKAQGVDVINLSVGEPDFHTPDHIKEAAKAAIDNNFTFYTPVPGYLSLRKAICEKLRRENGIEFAPEQIIVSNGAKQSLCNCILSLINPGDEVIIPTPAWVSYVEMVKLAEGVNVLVPAGVDQNFKITAAQLEAAITPKARMVLLCSPSNPTGSVYSRDELRALADVLAKYPARNLTSVKIKNKVKIVPDGAEIRKMLDVAGCKRNKAIIMTLATTGMRISELGSITLEQYNSRVDDAIVITGKGNKQRVIQFAPETIGMIDDYIKWGRKDGCDRLFTSNLGNPIDPQCTSDMLKRTAKRAGIENWHDISNHYMRAAFATIKSEAGVPIEVIKDMLGHSDISITSTYIKRTEQRAKASMAVVNF